jgi:hypothetical protein
MRALWPLALCVALLSCAPDDGLDDETAEQADSALKGPDYEVQYRTKYVDIAPGFTQPICRGTLDEIDHHMEVAADLLDIEIQGRTTLFWYNQNAAGAWADNSEICTWCKACGGCYRPGVVHTGLYALHHELIHVVVTAAWGLSDTLFEEGIALGLDRVSGTYAPGVLTIYSALDNEKPSEIAGSGRQGGGHFSPFLTLAR